MRCRLDSRTLRRIDREPRYNGGYAQNVVAAFRHRMQFIRGAANENDLRAFKSYHFEKLVGDRAGQYSIRLNDQFRLVFKIEKDKQKGNVLVILEIVDYHRPR